MRYYRVSPGSTKEQEKECLEQGYVAMNYGIKEDLTPCLHLSQLAFRERFMPYYYMCYPDMSVTEARSAMSKLWYFCCNLEPDDVIISRFRDGTVRVGLIDGLYKYVPNTPLPHRRIVEWIDIKLDILRMSPQLRPHITATLFRSANLSEFAEELESLITQAMDEAGLEFY